MSFFDHPAPDSPPAAGSPHSDLAERMRQMHVLLIHAFQRAATSYRHGRFDGCVLELGEFDRVLRAYLAGEEAELQDIMTLRHASEPHRLLAMRQVRAKLRQLARRVHEMLQPPHPSRPNPARGPGHELEFDQMQRTVLQCVDTSERELLPLLGAPARAEAPPRRDDVVEAMPIGSIWRKASTR